jgi:hypothetical protein
MTKQVQLIGKTIKHVGQDEDNNIIIEFTDGFVLGIEGVKGTYDLTSTVFREFFKELN